MNPTIKRTKAPGAVPTVNNFPNSNTYVWNEADGKLYGLRIENGARTVVLIGGGINFIGEVHARLHDLESVLDHAPVSGDRKGKWLRTHPATGDPVLAPNVFIGAAPPDAVEGDLWYDESDIFESDSLREMIEGIIKPKIGSIDSQYLSGVISGGVFQP